MVEIILDGTRCDVWEGYTPPKNIFQIDLASTADIEKQRTGHSVELVIPSTPQNDRLMCYAADPCCAERFNATAHEAVVRIGGVEMMRGVVHLLAVEREEGRLSYRLRVRRGGSEWVESASRTAISQANIAFSDTLNGTTILKSWMGSKAVRFLPVCYDDYRAPYDEKSLYPPQRVMTVGDYYPFLSVESLLRDAVERGGYTLAGEWVNSKEFRSLMMSGRYAEAESGSLSRRKAFAGFEAGRDAEAVATADGQGRVWLSPLVLTSSLGAFVTTTEGEELYNNNSCLQLSTTEGVVYKPAAGLTVGFEYYLKYATDYEMISSTRLRGFDAIYLGDGCDVQFEIANPFRNKRDELQANMQYRCKVFDHEEGSRYRLTCYHGSSHSVVSNLVEGDFTFTTPMVDVGQMSCVLLKVGDDGVAKVYNGDWAVYEGHVDLVGQTMVEVTVQSPPEYVSPWSGKSFNQLYLHGAKEGQSVTLSAECRLRPIFSPTAAFGTKLDFGSVAAVDAQLIDVVKAVQQMFNLRIYTDESSRRVYVEPRDEFYRGDEWDWSAKVDLSCPVEAEDIALEHSERLRLAYRAEGDGAVARFNASADEPLGVWCGEIDSHAAKQGEQRELNPLFSPTLSSTPYADAPSAMVMQVGDRDADEVAKVTTRIVRYEGLRELPQGERWGFPAYGESYPFAAFHSPEEFTLCFEDRDGVQGLHRYYDDELRQRSLRRRLRLTLKLTPLELQSLGEWCSSSANLRSTFVLSLNGQRAKYHLEAVESYDVERGCAVCRFVRQTND